MYTRRVSDALAVAVDCEDAEDERARLSEPVCDPEEPGQAIEACSTLTMLRGVVGLRDDDWLKGSHRRGILRVALHVREDGRVDVADLVRSPPAPQAPNTVDLRPGAGHPVSAIQHLAPNEEHQRTG